jgi:hypothetical protein
MTIQPADIVTTKANRFIYLYYGSTSDASVDSKIWNSPFICSHLLIRFSTIWKVNNPLGDGMKRLRKFVQKRELTDLIQQQRETAVVRARYGPEP